MRGSKSRKGSTDFIVGVNDYSVKWFSGIKSSVYEIGSMDINGLADDEIRYLLLINYISVTNESAHSYTGIITYFTACFKILTAIREIHVCCKSHSFT